MALELRFDPEAEGGDGRDADRVVMVRGAGSLSDMLCLRDADWEGDAPNGEFDVDGTTAVMNAESDNGGIRKPSDKTYSNCDLLSLHPEPGPLTAVCKRV